MMASFATWRSWPLTEVARHKRSCDAPAARLRATWGGTSPLCRSKGKAGASRAVRVLRERAGHAKRAGWRLREDAPQFVMMAALCAALAKALAEH